MRTQKCVVSHNLCEDNSATVRLPQHWSERVDESAGRPAGHRHDVGQAGHQ